MRRTGLSVLFAVSLLCFSHIHCSGGSGDGQQQAGDQTGDQGGGDGGTTATTDASQLLQPENVQYLGAFRLPDVSDPPRTWEWSIGGLTYNPDGDAAGAGDGYPGSLFGMGNAPAGFVSEISIPAPVNSRNLADLNTASTLQAFADVTGGLFNDLMEVPWAAIEYFNATVTGPKIHIAWGANVQGEGTPAGDAPSHAWFDVNLSAPNTRGAWFIGNQLPYSVNNYIFAIPKSWADTYTGQRYLATGRFKDGGLGGKGPSLFAYAPWQEGNPPAAGTHLHEITLLKYASTLTDTEETYRTNRMNHYACADEWEGGAWITTPGGRSAVIFAGSKATGTRYWYGYLNADDPTRPCLEPAEVSFTTCRNADGTRCADAEYVGCDHHLTSKGWWANRFDAQIIFYDPANLASVASGAMESHVPQPYAALDIDEHLYLPAPTGDVVDVYGSGDQRKHRVVAVAYDRARNFLYVMEGFADGAKPVIHVWRIAD